MKILYFIQLFGIAFAQNVEKYTDVKCCSEIFVSGGYEFKEKSKTFDLSKQFQRDSAQLPDRGRFYHSHVVYRGEVYLLGGFGMMGPSKTVYRIQDPKRSTWLTSFPMKNARGFFQALVFQDRIWACGGKNQTHFIRNCESFSSEDGWREEPQIMEPRFDHSTAVTKNGIYLIGSKTGERGAGRDPSTTYSTEHFPAAPAEGAQGGSFNPKWIPGPELPEPLYGQSTAVLLDTIYLFGGLHVLSRNERRTTVWALLADSDEWIAIGQMQTARSRPVIVNYGYQMMILGGCDKGCYAEMFTPSIAQFRYFKGWVKQDGSFSEAGCIWPWSCSTDLCYSIYSNAAIDILRGTGTHTTLGTTAATNLFFETTANPDYEDIFINTTPEMSILETTPGLPFIETTRPIYDLFESTPPSMDLFETTSSSDLYDMLSTPSDTDFDSLLEMESNLFLDEIKKTTISFTTEKPDSLKINPLCDKLPSILCDMLARPSPFSPQEKNLDLVKQDSVFPTPRTQMTISIQTMPSTTTTTKASFGFNKPFQPPVAITTTTISPTTTTTTRKSFSFPSRTTTTFSYTLKSTTISQIIKIPESFIKTETTLAEEIPLNKTMSLNSTFPTVASTKTTSTSILTTTQVANQKTSSKKVNLGKVVLDSASIMLNFSYVLIFIILL